MQHPSRQCSLRSVDRVKEDCFGPGHINKGVLPKGFALLPAAAGGEHFVDPRTCSIVEAIKLSRKNNPPDGRGMRSVTWKAEARCIRCSCAMMVLQPASSLRAS